MTNLKEKFLTVAGDTLRGVRHNWGGKLMPATTVETQMRFRAAAVAMGAAMLATNTGGLVLPLFAVLGVGGQTLYSSHEKGQALRLKPTAP